VYREIEPAAPQIGGWLRKGDLVLVYPTQDGGIGGVRQENDDEEYPQENDAGGYSTVVALPTTGPGLFLSPYTFLGVLGEVP
jgi:hypothetical protein